LEGTRVNKNAPDDPNADQIAFWNGPGGESWAGRQEVQDRILEPIASLTIDRAAVVSGERVVDIGCGCGGTTIELARRVGGTGRVLGLDVSAPMLARAAERVRPGLAIEFVRADATVHELPRDSFDLLFSRFGVMFFAEPARAFANLRSGLRSGGRLCFACWRAPEVNPWLMLPLKAAYEHVPPLPQVGPDDPGPFSLARPERVRAILEEAGFASAAIEPSDLELDVSNGGGLEAAVANALELGPARRALVGHSPETARAVAGSIRRTLASYQRAETVPLAAAMWIVSAGNP
jgi:SAM-dependent methyltransferase